MAQNLPKLERLPNLGVKMDKKCYKEPPSEIGRVGISENNSRLSKIEPLNSSISCYGACYSIHHTAEVLIRQKAFGLHQCPVL